MSFLDRFKKKSSDDGDVSVDEVVDTQESKGKSGKRKGLGGLFGGNKQKKSIIETMGLNEAVASMGLSVLNDIVESDESSAVRELDEGFSVIAITEQMLQDLNVDVKSPDFGSFANSISSEHIESLLLESDLNNGVVVLIPNRDTLDFLEEFGFLQELTYRWAIIPFDIEDESSAILLENGATLGDLNVIADDNLQLKVENGMIMPADDPFEESALDRSALRAEKPVDPTLSSDPFDDNDDVFADIMDDDLESIGGIMTASGEIVGGVDSTPAVSAPIDDFVIEDDDDFDFEIEDDLADDDFDFDLEGEEDFGFSIDEEEFDDFDELDELDDLVDDIDFGADDFDTELQTVDEGYEMIEGVLDREFNNSELGLSVKGDAFNHQFGDVRIIEFDEELIDDSELSHTILEMRRDANTQLKRLHNTNIQKLRSIYQNGVSDIHDRIVETLDHKDNTTIFGEEYFTLISERDSQLDMADGLVARNRERLDIEYSSRRDDFGDRAKREALSKFDDLYEEKHNKEKQELGDIVESKIKLNFDSRVSDLYEDRRNVANRIFDKMTTGLLLKIQKLHEEHVVHENELYEDFYNEIDAYMRDNYTDEVIRAKALATQQRQHHEAEEIRAEYEQMLKVKQRQLEEAELKADSELRQLESSHSKVVQETVAEYKRQVTSRESEIQEMRENANKLQERLVEIGKEKDEEYVQRMRTFHDTIESQRQQLAYEQDRANKQDKRSTPMLMAMVIVGIALGLIGGVIIGSSRSEPAQAPRTELSYQIEDESTDSLENALATTFNHVFAYDETLV